jgi:two-component system response regulator ResD
LKSDRARLASKSLGRILVIDDEPIIAELLNDVFSRHGYEVETCIGGEAGLERAAEGRFDLVVSDFAMPGANGLDLARHLASADPRARVVIVSAFLDPDVEEALGAQSNIEAILRKPFDIFEVVHLADRITKGGGSGLTSARSAKASESS